MGRDSGDKMDTAGGGSITTSTFNPSAFAAGLIWIGLAGVVLGGMRIRQRG